MALSPSCRLVGDEQGGTGRTTTQPGVDAREGLVGVGEEDGGHAVVTGVGPPGGRRRAVPAAMAAMTAVPSPCRRAAGSVPMPPISVAQAAG
ncbi:hypothetical protein [Streptomyces sp. BK239]|uniref:hypothetical protein n=1 Tax=Streptomyces sp. BK239 TaxID=2512155 RepID=UPI0013EF2548